MGKAKQMIETLYQQALKNQHCDVKIMVHGKVYGAHRGVLVQASQYFKKLFSGSFKESHSGEISFNEIAQNAEMVESILEYVYLGNFDFEVHAPEDVLQVASLLLLDDLIKCCQKMLLERLTLDNALHTWSWAHLYDLKPLEEVCKALCRYRFHDTIIHQPDTMKLPVDFLCYIIKERVLDFVDETTKLTFLQCWLQDYTRKCLMKSKGIKAKVSHELKEVEPNVAAALQEPDFLSKHFQCTKSCEEQVDCIVSVNNTESNTKTLSVCDLKAGKWYESSAITHSEGFTRYLAIEDRFIIFQNYKEDELYAFDNSTKKGTDIFIPTYSFKGSDHIFVLNGIVYLFVAMSDWAVPSMDDSACGTNTTETVRREGNGEGCSSHHKDPAADDGHKGPEYTSGNGASVDTCDQTKPKTVKKPDEPFEFPLLNPEDMASFEEFESLLENLEENPVNLTLQNNCGIKHCLFKLETTYCFLPTCSNCQRCVNECPCEAGQGCSNHSPPATLPTCQKCRPSWRLVCEVPGIGPKVMLNKYETKEFGGRFWIMAFGTTKNSNNGECSEEGGEEEEKGPFWFCVETLIDSDQGVRVLRLSDPPERRTQRSRGVNWGQIELVNFKGCFGLRSFKSPVRYSIYFDASDWRWKWVSYKTEYNHDEGKLRHGYPARIKLPIRRKKTCYEKYGVQWIGGKHNPNYRSCCYYPYINQLWSYKSEEEGWRELHPPPGALACSSWKRITVSQPLLRSLTLIKPRISVINEKGTASEYGEGPLADYEFVAE